MGLISFAKRAGNKILRRDDDDDEQQRQQESQTAPSQESAPVQEAVVVTASESAPMAESAASAGPVSSIGTVTGSGPDRRYTTRAGDTIDTLAAYFFFTKERFLAENPGLSDDGTPLREGMSIRVPEDPVAAEGSAAQSAPSEEPAVAAPAAESEHFGGSPAAEAAASERLVQLVQTLGLSVQDLSIQVSGETATVTGTTPTQEEREKVVLVVGNTEGIAQVDDQLNVVTPAPEAVFYEVQPGDTLAAIAQAHYGDPAKYPQIFDAYRPMLENPDLIYPGQMLRIPAA
jgi:phage tail protein X/LysM repeat protein